MNLSIMHPHAHLREMIMTGGCKTGESVMPNDEMYMGVPPDAGPQQEVRYDVISPKCGVRLTCTVLDPRILGLLTHFDRSREYPRGKSWFCSWEEGRCDRCRLRLPQIWQGYLGVWCHTLNKRIILCFGVESNAALQEFVKKIGGLHLARFDVRKPETGTKARLIWEEASLRGCHVDLPPFDIIPSVARCLGVGTLPDYRYTVKELSDKEVPNG